MKFFCEYCGNRIDAEVDRKCPNCGASYKKNKNFIKIQEEKNQQQEINNEFKNEVMSHTLGVMKASKFIFLMPIVVFIIIVSIMIFAFVNTNKHYNDDSNKVKEEVESMIESTVDDINGNNKSEKEEKIVVNFNEYGATKDYQIKVTKYEKVEDKFKKVENGYELVKFHLMLQNLSNEELTKEDVYCIIDGVSQTNDFRSGYSDLPMFIPKELTVTGTATFIVPKDATSYDIRYGDYITVHIEK